MYSIVKPDVFYHVLIRIVPPTLCPSRLPQAYAVVEVAMCRFAHNLNAAT